MVNRALVVLPTICVAVALARAQSTIPNGNGISGNRQSALVRADLKDWAAGLAGTGVAFVGTDPCKVTAQGAPTMTVTVAACTLMFNGSPTRVAAGNVTIATAHRTLPRVDLVVANSAGVKSAVAGAPSADADLTMPDVPASFIPLAAIFVPAATTSIATSQIVDKRTPVAMCTPATFVNVACYGAIADYRTDNTAAIQAAIDAAQASTTGGRVVFPGRRANCYALMSPIVISKSNINIEGETSGDFTRSPCLKAGGDFLGPLIRISTASTDATWTASLVAGPGRALATTEANPGSQTYIDLSDAGPPAQLNDRTAFTVECFFKVTAPPRDSHNTVLASSGQLGGISGTAFAIKVTANRALVATMNISGNPVTLNTADSAIAIDTVYHVALVFSGTTVQLFYGSPGNTSTLVGTVSQSGTVQQQRWETMSIGGMHGYWPHGEVFQPAITGAIDSVRLSSHARYASTYTVPSSKLSWDANSLILENFDNETAAFSIVRTSTASSTYLSKYPDATAGKLVSFVDMSGLDLEAGHGIGIWLNHVVESTFHDMTISSGLYGITSAADAFENTFRKVHFWGNTDDTSGAGLSLNNASGLTKIEDCIFSAWPVGITTTAGTISITNTYVHGDRQRFALVVREGELTLSGSSFSNEDLFTHTYIADVYLDAVRSAAIISGVFEHTLDAGPFLQVNGGGAITLVAPHVLLKSGAPEAIEIVRAPATRVLLLNANKNQSGTPWTTTPQHVEMLPSSLGAPPTISSGFGTSPSVTAGYADAFRVNVGTGGSASTGVVGLPAAPNGWNCSVADITTPDSFNTAQTGSTTTTASFKNYSRTMGTAVAWMASDILAISCRSF